MPYTSREVVYIEVKGISAGDVYALAEFLRVSMITPFVKNEVVHGADGKLDGASFSGGFTRDDATRVEEWLRSRGAVREESSG